MTAKAKSLTQSMSWLHTWSGLLLGWVLFAIFLTGTLAVFDKEIDNWMRPETPAHSVDQRQALGTALSYLRRAHAAESSWNIGLPTERSPQLSVSVGEQRRGGGGGGAGVRLNPQTGEAYQARETAGGGFFFRFHYTLHMPRSPGIWAVGLAALAMLVALISGIVIHKKFFKDFFTFRPAKGQRSWLDAHNASAVLLLPFHLMITYTGLVIFYLIYMPAAVDALYDGDREAYSRSARGGAAIEQGRRPAETGVRGGKLQSSEPGAPAGGREGMPARGEAEQPREGGRGESAPAMAGREGRRPAAPDEARGGDGRWVPLALETILAEAEQTMGPIAGLAIRNPGRPDAVVEARPVLGNVIELTKGRSMQFNGVTGEVLRGVPPSGAAQRTQRVMSGLHFAQFGGYPMRWLYFVCGLISCAMIATGLIHFTVKRRRRPDAEGLLAAAIHQAAERINVAVVAGLSVACVGMLWANRLLPVELAERAGWEIRVFFGLWLLSLMHACARPWLAAWREQLGLVALLCLLLPLLDRVLEGQWVQPWLELTVLALGALSAWAVWKLGRPATQPLRSARRPIGGEEVPA